MTDEAANTPYVKSVLVDALRPASQGKHVLDEAYIEQNADAILAAIAAADYRIIGPEDEEALVELVAARYDDHPRMSGPSTVAKKRAEIIVRALLRGDATG